MGGEEDHSKYWQRAKWRNVSFYVVWLVWVPAGIVYWWVHREDGFTWTLAMWGVPLLWSGARWQPLTCPGCKRTFDQKGAEKNPKTTHCLHCGLARSKN